MKKNYLAALAVTAVLGLGGSGTALADPAFLDGNGIIGSPHDFTDNVIFGALQAGTAVPVLTANNGTSARKSAGSATPRTISSAKPTRMVCCGTAI